MEQFLKFSKIFICFVYVAGVFSKHKDTATAINAFLRRFQEQNNATVTRYFLENDIIKAGNNFCSIISRLKIEYEIEGRKLFKSVLLKIPSLSPNFEKIQKTDLYNRELYAYETLLPKMYELWDGEVFSPEIYVMTADAKVLVMEDLTDCGYSMMDKKNQLGLEHCTIALRNLAQYHALSVKFLQTKSEYYEEYSSKGCNMESSLSKIFMDFFDQFVNKISSLVSPSIMEKLQPYRQVNEERLKLYFSSNEDGLNVVVHGDFWLNNILFKYDQGAVCGAKFVDWQACRKTSPALDLIYFFVSSVRFEVYEKHHEELLNLYIDVFNKTMCRLRCDCEYTRDQLEQDIRKYKFLHLNTVICFLQVIMTDERSFSDMFAASDQPLPFSSLAINWLNYLDARDLL